MKDNIVELNRDKESYVMQVARARSQRAFSRLYESKTVPLSFIHFSDIHNVPDLWDRMVQYLNRYQEHLSFAIHTGDYCGGIQELHTDMYSECTASVHPIFNCPGNHDCVSNDDWSQPAPKKIAHDILFHHTENWDVIFADCEYSMSYYKDFPESNVRMIVLDLYYDIDTTREWLSDVLDDAYEKGIHVVTAMHEPTDYITQSFDVSFHHLGDYESAYKKYEADRESFAFDHRGRKTFEDIIAAYIARGGNYVCNLAGHDHIDSFGYTDKGVLNVVVENAANWDMLGESNRIPGTKSYDCFNVLALIRS